MKSRSELRDIIIKIIYQFILYKDSTITYDIDELIKEQLEVENSFVNDCIDGIHEHQKDIVDMANKYLKDWTMDRLNKVDQAILSMNSKKQ